ncbi:MAG: hypothetical protein R2755_34425 [Acidimicrobiales bacterium]
MRGCPEGAVTGDEHELVERSDGCGEVHRVVAPQPVGRREVTRVPGQLGGQLDVIDLGDEGSPTSRGITDEVSK